MNCGAGSPTVRTQCAELTPNGFKPANPDTRGFVRPSTFLSAARGYFSLRPNVSYIGARFKALSGRSFRHH